MKALKKLSIRNTTSCDIRTKLGSGNKLISQGSSQNGLMLYHQEATTRASGQDAERKDGKTDSGEGFYLTKSRPLDLSVEWERTKHVGLLGQLPKLREGIRDEIGFSSNRENNINFYECSDEKRELARKKFNQGKPPNNVNLDENDLQKGLFKPKKLRPLCGLGTEAESKEPDIKHLKVHQVPGNYKKSQDILSKKFFNEIPLLEESEVLNGDERTEGSGEKSAKIFADHRNSLRSSYKDFNIRRNYRRTGKSVREVSLRLDRRNEDRHDLVYELRGTSQTQLVMESQGSSKIVDIYKQKKMVAKNNQQTPFFGEKIKLQDKSPENSQDKKEKWKQVINMKSEKQIRMGSEVTQKRLRKKNKSRNQLGGSQSKGGINEATRIFEQIRENYGIASQIGAKVTPQERKHRKGDKPRGKGKAPSKMGFQKLFKDKRERKERKFGTKPVSLSQYSSLNYSRGYKGKSMKEIVTDLKHVEVQAHLNNEQVDLEGQMESQIVTADRRPHEPTKKNVNSYGFQSEIISIPNSNSKKKSRTETRNPTRNLNSNPKNKSNQEEKINKPRTGSVLELTSRTQRNLEMVRDSQRVLTFASVVDLKANVSEPLSTHKKRKSKVPPKPRKSKLKELKLGPIKAISHSRGYAHIRNKSSTTFNDPKYKLQGSRKTFKISADPGKFIKRAEMLSNLGRRGSVRDLKIKEYTKLLRSEDDEGPRPIDFFKIKSQLKSTKGNEKEEKKGGKIGILKGQTFASLLEEGKERLTGAGLQIKANHNQDPLQISRIKEKKDQIGLKAEPKPIAKEKAHKKGETKESRQKDPPKDFKILSKEVLAKFRKLKGTKQGDASKPKRVKQRPYFGSRDKDPIFKNKNKNKNKNKKKKNFTKKSEAKFKKPEPIVKRHGQLETREAYPGRGLPVTSTRALRREYRKTETSPSHMLRKNRIKFLPRGERILKREAKSRSKFRISRDAKMLAMHIVDSEPLKESSRAKNPDKLNFYEQDAKKIPKSNKQHQKTHNEFQKGAPPYQKRKNSKNMESEINQRAVGHPGDSPVRVKKSQQSRPLVYTNDKDRSKRALAQSKFANPRGKKRQMRRKQMNRPKQIMMKVPYSPKHKNESAKLFKQDGKKKSGQGMCSAKNLIRGFNKVSYFDFKKNNGKDSKTGKVKRSRNARDIGRNDDRSEFLPKQRNFSVNKVPKRHLEEK